MFIPRCLRLLILVISVLAIGCGTDNDNSINPISDLSEIDVELETNSYEESSLPEIFDDSQLNSGMYKMHIGEAYICKGDYIYFQRRIDSDGDGIITDADNKVRIYLEIPTPSEISSSKTI